MSGVEREPLTITLPHATAGTTVYLVAAHCEPLAIRPTRQEAEQLCENAERATLADPPAATFTWWAVDEEDPDDGPHELYITTSGHEHRTEYTVTPIHIHQDQPPAPADDGDRLTPALTADVRALLERHGYRPPTSQAAQDQAITETLAVLGFLGKAFEGHTPQADPATTRWNEAIDWLLNSRHTADDDIQAAFWALADGRCTVEEADRGYLADYTPLTDLLQEEA